MATLSLEEGYFGALGVTDPVRSVNNISLGRTVDFKVSPVEASKNYPILPIPAGFYVTSIAIEQTELADGATAIALKKYSNSAAVGDGATLATSGSCVRVASSVNALVDAADMLCIVPAAAIAAGKINVYVTGYMQFGESTETVNTSVTEAYRAKLQTAEQAADNVSGGNMDPRKYEGVVS